MVRPLRWGVALAVAVYLTVPGQAHAQVPRLGSDTSARVTPEAYARAQALVASAPELSVLWRTVATLTEGSPASAAVKQGAAQQIAQAETLAEAGRNGPAYSLLMQGLSTLTEQPWTPREAYRASLVLQLPTLVADLTQPLAWTLTQRYPAAVPAGAVLRMQLSLQAAPPRAGGGDGPPPMAVPPEGRNVKTFWTTELSSRDLVADPMTYAVDVAEVPEGRYLLKLQVLDGTQSLGSITAPLTLLRDVSGRAAALDRKLAAVPGHDSAKLSARYPFDLVRAINGWRRQTVDHIDLLATLREAEALADQLAAGHDPLFKTKGDHKRHYRLAEAGEILPYRLYVPAAWDGKTALPLVVNLHGGGGNEDGDFDFNRPGIARMAELAERHGCIVVSPSGYRPSGGFGTSYGLTPAGRPGVWPGSPAATATELSELDVIRVMDLVAQEYGTDAQRTYLVGNSMGGGGVWHIGSKYAERFAAIAPNASSMDLREMPAFPFDRLKTVPTMAAVGEFDVELRQAVARYGVAELQRRGDTARFVPVKGGNHGNAWRMALDDIFVFFLQYRKGN